MGAPAPESLTGANEAMAFGWPTYHKMMVSESWPKIFAKKIKIEKKDKGKND